MSIYSLPRESLQSLADTFARYRPSVGKVARVVDGRKHKGKVGTITWHGKDGYSPAWRYGDSATAFGRDCMGTYGFRIRIEPADGSAPFFVPANYVMTCEVGSLS